MKLIALGTLVFVVTLVSIELVFTFDDEPVATGDMCVLEDASSCSASCGHP